jgi:flagellar hook-associated protein 1
MSQYNIALSGLQVARRAIDLIGSNIANATTEGYHRQDLSTSSVHTIGGSQIGDGVEITGVLRSADLLLDRELSLMQADLGQNSQELSTLRLVENALGELDSQGLALAIDGYFNALRELASQPNSEALQYQAAWAADGMAKQFNQVDSFLFDLERQVALQAEQATTQANGLIQEIAQLNDDIQLFLASGSNANTACDRRDQAVRELAELIDIEITGFADATGPVGISAWGTPLVTRGQYILLEAGSADTTGNLGVSVQGVNHFRTDVSGGKLGGLVALNNEILSGIQDRLDSLASEIVFRTNQQHLQGIGPMGSFTELTGVSVEEEPLSQWSAWGEGLTTGTINVRVTDLQTGQVSTHQISVDGDSTLATIASALNDVDGLVGGVVNSGLHIESADSDRYEFDFLPVPATDLEVNAWTGTAGVTLDRGTYTSAGDHTFTFEVTGPGADGEVLPVGTDGLSIVVRDETGAQVGATVDLGLAYVPGTALTLDNGLELSLAAGSLRIGEQFGATVYSDASLNQDPVLDMNSGPWLGSAEPVVSGTLDATTDATFNCTVIGPVAGALAQVGVTEGLTLQVRNGAGELIGTHSIGLGYAAGDQISIGSGISLSLPVGTVVSGQQFTVEVPANSDSSGFLAMAGINALFSGSSARDIAVRQEMLDNPQRIATALTPEGSDNANITRLAELGDASNAALNYQAPTDFFRLIVTNIGNDISFRQARQEAMEGAVSQLEDERDMVSGVDINEEAARLLIYQNMFQACAKFLTAQVESIEYLMNIL